MYKNMEYLFKSNSKAFTLKRPPEGHIQKRHIFFHVMIGQCSHQLPGFTQQRRCKVFNAAGVQLRDSADPQEFAARIFVLDSLSEV